jgi:hypothetical protein
MYINELAYVNMDKGFPPTIQCARQLAIVCNVPDIDFV